MRKNLFLGILLLLTTSVVIYSCRKDTGLFSDDQTVSASADDLESSKIYHAKFATLNASTYKQLFASEDKVAMAEGSAAKKYDFIKLAPVWKKAYTLKTSSGAALIVVPTIENKLDGKDFQVKRFFLFTKKGSGISDGKIIEVLGLHYALDEKINDILAGYDSNSFADLNGAIFLYDLNYFRLRGEVIKAGKPTGVQASLYNLASAKKSIDGKVANGYYDTGAPGVDGCRTLWYCDGNGTGITCWNQGYLDGSCYPPTGVPSGSDSGYDSSSGGGGGGSYGGNTAPKITVYISGPKVNPTNENKCFDKTQPATLTIYVQQPTPHTRAMIGENQVGHAFVGITQGGITRYMGFYPNSSNVSIRDSVPSEIHDNSNELYHVSISKPVSATQLGQVIDYMNHYPSQYSLRNYNCTDFAIGVAQQGGLSLPATTGNTTVFGQNFSGRNPGDLGEDIRAMALPSDAQRNEAPNNSPQKQGSCQ